MVQVGGITMTTASLVVVSVVGLTQNYYKAYPGYWMKGNINKTLEVRLLCLLLFI